MRLFTYKVLMKALPLFFTVLTGSLISSVSVFLSSESIDLLIGNDGNAFFHRANGVFSIAEEPPRLLVSASWNIFLLSSVRSRRNCILKNTSSRNTYLISSVGMNSF